MKKYRSVNYWKFGWNSFANFLQFFRNGLSTRLARFRSQANIIRSERDWWKFSCLRVDLDVARIGSWIRYESKNVAGNRYPRKNPIFLCTRFNSKTPPSLLPSISSNDFNKNPLKSPKPRSRGCNISINVMSMFRWSILGRSTVSFNNEISRFFIG